MSEVSTSRDNNIFSKSQKIVSVLLF